uniref:Uncharacterized protein n=1 Tax=Rhizophora mucronata TaxID=61149 RepID=A0A2P2NQN6_RHIMU
MANCQLDFELLCEMMLDLGLLFDAFLS